MIILRGVLHPLLHLGGGARNKLIRIIYNENNALHIRIGGVQVTTYSVGGGLHLEDVFLQTILSQKTGMGVHSGRVSPGIFQIRGGWYFKFAEKFKRGYFTGF